MSEIRLPAVPTDHRLPGLRVLLSSETVKGLLESQIHGTNERILDCRVDYLRYCPGTSCKATYVITSSNEITGRTAEHVWYGICLTREAFPKAHEQVLARVWTKPAIGSPVTVVPEHQIIVFAYPNDRCLAGLTTVSDECALRKLLGQHDSGRGLFSDGRLLTTLLRYKPEQRAVFRCQIEGALSKGTAPSGTTVYCKIYSGGGGRNALDTVVRLLRFFGSESTLAFPEPLGFAVDQNMLISGSAPGVILRSLLDSPDQCRAFARVGEALAKLHAYNDPELPHVPLTDWVEKIQQPIDLLRRFVPSLKGQIRKISRGLRRRTPQNHECASGFVFGDCHPGNIFLDWTRIGFIDFDRAHMGCSAVDIGRILAWVRYWCLRGRLANDVPLREAFLQAYMRAAKRSLNANVVAWWTAVMLLQTALKPARRLKSDRSHKVEMLLQEVAQTLR